MIASFARLQEFVSRRAGLSLDDDKQFLAEARLAPVARRFGEANVDRLIARLTAGDDEIARAVIDSMTTHETLFFRDRAPFDFLSGVVLPRLIDKRADERSIRVWCAGCATGQEPYSIAIIIDEHARALMGWRVEILATDVSRSAIEIARKGDYNQFEVQRGLPAPLLVRYFGRSGDQIGRAHV